jgi:hypothetical protein
MTYPASAPPIIIIAFNLFLVRRAIVNRAYAMVFRVEQLRTIERLISNVGRSCILSRLMNYSAYRGKVVIVKVPEQAFNRPFHSRLDGVYFPGTDVSRASSKSISTARSS